MQYIVSRRFVMPSTGEQLARSWYFSLWKTRQWPYDDVTVGDIFYWYESPKRRIVWEAQVVELEKFKFGTKGEARRRLIEIFGPFDEGQPYYQNPPTSGYAMTYRTEARRRLVLPKPEGFRLPMLGWLAVTPEIERIWLRRE